MGGKPPTFILLSLEEESNNEDAIVLTSQKTRDLIEERVTIGCSAPTCTSEILFIIRIIIV
jgi:hypothetical protein